MLYATTAQGGTGICYLVGCGTIFNITTAGAGSVIYSFKGVPDGQDPVASLVNLRGTLYGTTYHGGTNGTGNGLGTIFAVTPSGSESVVHSFGSGLDGANPAPL